MAEQAQVLNIINENYPMNFDTIEYVWDSGCINGRNSVKKIGVTYYLNVNNEVIYY